MEKEELVQKYLIEKWTNKKFRESGLSERKLNKLLLLYNIPKRKIGDWFKTSEESKVHKILLKFPFATREFFEENYVKLGHALPFFSKNYGLGYHHTQRLLSFYGFGQRSLQEATNHTTTKEKRIKTIQERYGVDNPSQSQIIKDKKAETFVKNYGVDNIWKTSVFKEKLDFYYERKYNVNYSDFQRMRSKNVWKLKSEEEKKRWLNCSILSEESISKKVKCKGYIISNLEKRIAKALLNFQIPFETQFRVERKIFDFKIPNTKILIEIFGTYWHADPQKYVAEDLIHYKFADIVAKDIWEKDKKRIQIAEKHGYIVYVIWEREIKACLTDSDIVDLINNKINENQKH